MDIILKNTHLKRLNIILPIPVTIGTSKSKIAMENMELVDMKQLIARILIFLVILVAMKMPRKKFKNN